MGDGRGGVVALRLGHVLQEVVEDVGQGAVLTVLAPRVQTQHVVARLGQRDLVAHRLRVLRVAGRRHVVPVVLVRLAQELVGHLHPLGHVQLHEAGVDPASQADLGLLVGEELQAVVLEDGRGPPLVPPRLLGHLGDVHGVGDLGAVDEVLAGVGQGAAVRRGLGARVDVQPVLALLGQRHADGQHVALLRQVHEGVQGLILHLVHPQLGYELQRARHPEAQLELVLGHDDAHLLPVAHRALRRDGGDAEVPHGLLRPPLARRAVGQRVHLARHPVAHDLELAGALQLERRHVSVVLLDAARVVDLVGEDLQEVVGRRGHVHAEGDRVLHHGLEDEALQVGAPVGQVLEAVLVGEAQLVVEDQVVLVLLGDLDADLAAALVVGVHHGQAVAVEVHAVVEEDGAHEGQCLELLQRDGALQQLPFGLVGEKLL